MSDQIFIRFRGRIQGPFPVDQLQSLAKRGQFSRAYEVSADGLTWTRAISRPELFPPAAPEFELVDVPPVATEHAPSSAPPPTDVWHYHQLGAKRGPVDFSHLQYLVGSGQISHEDLVWKEGMPEWIPAGRVPGLFNSTTAAPGGPPTPVYVGLGNMQSFAPGMSEFPRVSGLAVASLVLGILWLFGIGSLLAIIFGAVSIHQIRISRGKLTGTGLAVAGLVLGIVMIAGHLIVIIMSAWTASQLLP